jgi:ABC-type nitrate/sulfonate/bicarbonate transport system permease component
VPAQSQPRRGRRRLLALLTPVASIVVGLGLWQLVVTVARPNPLAVVGPVRVLSATASLARTGELGGDVGHSLRQLAVGMVIALVLGVLAGLLLGGSRTLAAVFDPWVTALYTVPVIAVAPLIIVAAGLGDAANIAIVAAAAFFPIAINAKAGARAVDGALHDLSASFGADRRETFRHIVVPGSLPYVLTGARLAVGRALIALVAADLFGSTTGLGFLILSGQQNLNTANVYVGVAALAVIGLVLTGGVGLLERRVAASYGVPSS